MTAGEILAASLAVVATAFVVLAVAGLFRFPEIFSRVHAATKASSLGVLLVILAAATRMDDVGDVVKILLAGALQLITAPVAAHMVSRAAYEAGPAPDDLVVDHLADSLRATGDQGPPE